jgi:hypothetical protein
MLQTFELCDMQAIYHGCAMQETFLAANPPPTIAEQHSTICHGSTPRQHSQVSPHQTPTANFVSFFGNHAVAKHHSSSDATAWLHRCDWLCHVHDGWRIHSIAATCMRSVPQSQFSGHAQYMNGTAATSVNYPTACLYSHAVDTSASPKTRANANCSCCGSKGPQSSTMHTVRKSAVQYAPP